LQLTRRASWKSLAGLTSPHAVHLRSVGAATGWRAAARLSSQSSAAWAALISNVTGRPPQ
jgi:hypothetical protein